MVSTLVDPRLAEPLERPPLAAPPQRGGPARLTVVAATLGTWLAGALVFFWEQVASGFNKVMGDDGDGRLIAYLHEHWYGVLRGRNAWLDPAYFYPVKGVLGYCDTFFLNQVIYAPLRALGADFLLAFQLTLVGLTLIGFCSFVALVRRFLHASLPVALVGAWVFTFANSLSMKALHTQLYGVYWVPLLLYVGAAAWSSRTARPRQSAVLGGISGALGALLLFTNYYVAWFSFLALGISAVGFLLLNPRYGWAAADDGVRSGWRTLLAVAGGFAVGIVPFLVTYLPVAQESGGRRYADAMRYAGQVTDLWNVGPTNLLWRNVFDGTLGPAPDRLGNIEVDLAVPPLLVLTALALAVAAFAVYRRRADRATTPPPLAAVLALTGIVLALLPVKTDAGSAWALVWNLVPGAHAIRAIFRLQIVNQLVISLALVAGWTAVRRQWASLSRSTIVPLVAVAAGLLLMVEQVNVGDYSRIDRAANLARLGAVPMPPATCRSFYVTTANPAGRPWFALQIDAMLISQRLQLPTINGYSGVYPAGWLLGDPRAPAYPQAVSSWVAQHGLQGSVCGYDLTTRAWTPSGP